MNKITVTVRGGMVVDVGGIPSDCTVEVFDYDVHPEDYTCFEYDNDGEVCYREVYE